MKNELSSESMNINNPKWEKAIKRENELYKRNNEIRDDFERDYTRIVHSTAFRRMKHKTQVFYSPINDHICTRMEHVLHVDSISHTIASYLGLNTDLTKAIAIAHDLGHSPFGHQGERILSEISMMDIGRKFWHEQNGLEIVDKIELLSDNHNQRQNLNLTYAVRDGIISHCGEIDEESLRPRDENIDLKNYKEPNQFPPYTWEGCVVKIADKISYLGRDIEDAITLGFIDEHLKELYDILNLEKSESIINNTVLINDFIYDLCENSSIEKGLCFSEKMYNVLVEVKKFNYKNIYLSEKMKPTIDYFRLILNTIYNTLKQSFYEKEKIKKFYPILYKDFENWLVCYWNQERNANLKNAVIFNSMNEKDYMQAIIYYISGMTDNYAISTYNNIVSF